MEVITTEATVRDNDLGVHVPHRPVIDLEDGRIQVGSLILLPGEFTRMGSKIFVDKYNWVITWDVQPTNHQAEGPRSQRKP